ncbi:hypothetical protein ACF0H5_009409 [Mactra antiquata]
MDIICGQDNLCRMKRFVCFIIIIDVCFGVTMATNEAGKPITTTSGTVETPVLYRKRREQTININLAKSLMTPYPFGNYDYTYNFNEGESDMTDMLKFDSTHCQGLRYCTVPGTSFPYTKCYCDTSCSIFGDCCKGYQGSTVSTITKDQFKCLTLTEIVITNGLGIHMIAKCSSDWTHETTKRLCEEEASTNDVFLRVPVSDQSDYKFMYKNTYCAQCNHISNAMFWKAEILCRNETGSRSFPEMGNCSMFFIRPKSEVNYRTCQLKPEVINTCDDDYYAHNCTHGQFYLVYDSEGRSYRNEYCAYCNGVKDGLTCMSPNPSVFPTIDPVERSVYSLKLLVDFNKGTVEENDEKVQTVKCDNVTEILDVWTDKCRKIYCAPSYVLQNKACVRKFHSIHTDSHEDTFNCSLIKLDVTDYELINSSVILITSQNKIYSGEDFITNGSDVFMCSDKFSPCSEENCDSDAYVRFEFNAVESYMSLIGMIISIVALTITLSVYIAFPQLLNIPGKIIISLIISLGLAQIFFSIAFSIENIRVACSIIAKLIHYLFLCAFCWMNVIAIDLCMTFSNKFMTPGTGHSRSKRFMFYSLYAWCVPLLIVIIAIITDYVDSGPGLNVIKPKYGQGICWITSKYGLIAFFAVPLAIFKVIDVISFIFTSIYIARARKEGAMASQKRNTCSLLINIKLSLVMGLTWVFAFIANASNVDVMWYVFIIFNTLQGLFIALSFLCTKKVGRLLQTKYQAISTNFPTGTQLTSDS